MAENILLNVQISGENALAFLRNLQQGATQTEAALSGIPKAFQGLAAGIQETQRLEQAQRSAITASVQELQVLQQKIGIQKQAQAGTISLAEAEHKLAAAEIEVKTGSQQLANELARTQQEFAQNAAALKQEESSALSLTSAVSGLAGAYVAYRAARFAVGQTEQGVQVNAGLESNQLAIASLLQGATQLTDSFGHVVSSTQQWTANLAEAKSIQAQIAAISAQTLGTDEELLSVFRATLTFSRGQKGDLEDRLKLSQGLENLFKLQGLEGEHQTEETRQLLQLDSQRGQTTLALLGITFKQAEQYKQQGTLLQELLKPLEAYNTLAKSAETSWEGLTTSVQTFQRLFTANVFEGTFNGLKQVLVGIADELNHLRLDAGLSSSIAATDEQLQQLGKSIADVFATIQTVVSGIANFTVSAVTLFNSAIGGASLLHDAYLGIASTLQGPVGSALDTTTQRVNTMNTALNAIGGVAAFLLTATVNPALAAGLLVAAAGLDALVKKGHDVEAAFTDLNARVATFAVVAKNLNEGFISEAPPDTLKALSGILTEAEQQGIKLSESNKQIVNSLGLVSEALGTTGKGVEGLRREFAGLAKDTTEADKVIAASVKSVDAINKILVESAAAVTGNFALQRRAIEKEIADARKATEDALKRQPGGEVTPQVTAQLDTADAQKLFQAKAKEVEQFIAFEKHKTDVAQQEAAARVGVSLAEAKSAVSTTQNRIAQTQAELTTLDVLAGKETEKVAKTQQLGQLQSQLHAQRVTEAQIEIGLKNQDIALQNTEIQKLQEKQTAVRQQLAAAPQGPDLNEAAQRETLTKGIVELQDKIDEARNKNKGFQADILKLTADIKTQDTETATQQIENANKVRQVRLQGFEEQQKQAQQLKEIQATLDTSGQIKTQGDVSGVANRIALEHAEIDLLKARGASYTDLQAKERGLLALEKQLADLEVQKAQHALDQANVKVDAAQKSLEATAKEIAQIGLTTELNDKFNTSLDQTLKAQDAAAEAAIALGKARVDAAVEGIKAEQELANQQKETAKNALLSTGTLRDFFSDFAKGISGGTQELSRVLTSFAQNTSARFFQQLVVGKKENFDDVIIGNVSELFGLGDGGIVGQIFKQGGSTAFSQFSSAFTGGTSGGSGLSNLFGLFGSASPGVPSTQNIGVPFQTPGTGVLQPGLILGPNNTPIPDPNGGGGLLGSLGNVGTGLGLGSSLFGGGGGGGLFGGLFGGGGGGGGLLGGLFGGGATNIFGGTGAVSFIGPGAPISGLFPVGPGLSGAAGGTFGSLAAGAGNALGGIGGGLLGNFISGQFGIGQSPTGKMGGMAGGLVGGIGGGIAGGALLGAQLGMFAGPIGAAIGAALGVILGGVLGDLFKPGRIKIEKDNIQKFFSDVFKDVDFKVLKEKDVAEGLAGFDKLSKGALALGAVYAKELGAKATQGSIVRFGGQFLGNLKQMGDSSEEAQKKLEDLAHAMKADLGSAIETINGLTSQFSDHQKNNLLSLGQFDKEIADARKNLAQYGDTSQLTAKQLSELALAHGNTGSVIVTYNDLIAGAIDINTDFKSSVATVIGVNNLLAAKFADVVSAQGDVSDQTKALTQDLRDGKISLEEAAIGYNHLREAAGKAGLELKDFTLDPDKIKQFADFLKNLTFDKEDFVKGLGDALSEGLSQGLDPSKYGEQFDKFFNDLIKTNIINAIVAGFTQGLAVETLGPLFDDVQGLLARVATGQISVNDAGKEWNRILLENKDNINGVRDAFKLAGDIGHDVLGQFTEAGSQPDFSGFTSGLAAALQDGLSQGLDPSKYGERFDNFFKTYLRNAIITAAVEGFTKGLALETLKPFFEQVGALLKRVSSDSTGLTAEGVASQIHTLIQENAGAFAQLKAQTEGWGVAVTEVLTTLGLMPDTLDQTLQKVDELKAKLEQIAQEKIDVHINLQERLESIGVPGAGEKALALRQQNVNDLITKVKADPAVTGELKVTTEADFQKANAHIENTLKQVDSLSQAIVSNFLKEQSLINENYNKQVEGIKKAGDAAKESIKASFDAQKEASQARIDALNEEKDKIQENFQLRQEALNTEIEAVQKQLQAAQAFAQIGAQIRDQIVQLAGSGRSPLAAPGQLSFLQREAARLREQLAVAPEDKQADLTGKLAGVLEQELSTNAFQRGSTAYRDQFNAIVKELEHLRDVSLEKGKDVDSLQQQLVNLQEESKQLQKEQTETLKSIDKSIKEEQKVQQQLAKDEQAALKTQADTQQHAIDAARADADRQIAAAREIAAQQLGDLAGIQTDLLDKQEKLVGAQLSIQQQIADNTRRAADDLDKLVGQGGAKGQSGYVGSESGDPINQQSKTVENSLPEDFFTPHSSITSNAASRQSQSVTSSLPEDFFTPHASVAQTPAPAAASTAYPFKDPNTQPGQKWTNDHWQFVEQGADVTWDANKNQYYWHGSLLSETQYADLAAHGPTAQNGFGSAVGTATTTGSGAGTAPSHSVQPSYTANTPSLADAPPKTIAQTQAKQAPSASLSGQEAVSSTALLYYPPGTTPPSSPPSDTFTVSQGERNAYGNDYGTVSSQIRPPAPVPPAPVPTVQVTQPAITPAFAAGVASAGAGSIGTGTTALVQGTDGAWHPFAITYAAKGYDGTVTKPTVFLAGEGGQPEKVRITPATSEIPVGLAQTDTRSQLESPQRAHGTDPTLLGGFRVNGSGAIPGQGDVQGASRTTTTEHTFSVPSPATVPLAEIAMRTEHVGGGVSTLSRIPGELAQTDTRESNPPRVIAPPPLALTPSPVGAVDRSFAPVELAHVSVGLAQANHSSIAHTTIGGANTVAHTFNQQSTVTQNSIGAVAPVLSRTLGKGTRDEQGSPATTTIVNSPVINTLAAHPMLTPFGTVSNATTNATALTNTVTEGATTHNVFAGATLTQHPPTGAVAYIQGSTGEYSPFAVTYAATGYDGVVSTPTVFMAGEGGRPERVNIAPVGTSAPVSSNNTPHTVKILLEVKATVEVTGDNTPEDAAQKTARAMQPALEEALKEMLRSDYVDKLIRDKATDQARYVVQR